MISIPTILTTRISYKDMDKVAKGAQVEVLHIGDER